MIQAAKGGRVWQKGGGGSWYKPGSQEEMKKNNAFTYHLRSIASLFGNGLNEIYDYTEFLLFSKKMFIIFFQLLISVIIIENVIILFLLLIS